MAATQVTQATQAGSQGHTLKDRELRSQIRHLHIEAQHDKEDLTRLGSNKLQEYLEKAESLQMLVERPREQALDSELFQHLSHVGLEFAKKLVSGTQGITPLDLIRQLRARYVSGGIDSADEEAVAADPRAFNWHAMGRRVAYYFPNGPGVSCMLGPLDSRPKERKVAQRAKRAPVVAAVNPDELEAVREDEKQETDRNMEEMWRVINRAGGSTPLAELVCNPTSFSQTVENFFTLSFLVRDSRVRYTEDADLGVMVKVVTRNRGGEAEAAAAGQPAQQQGGGLERQQFVITLDHDEWHRMRQVVRASDCLMPNRQPGSRKRGRSGTSAAAAEQQQAKAAEEELQQGNGGQQGNEEEQGNGGEDAEGGEGEQQVVMVSEESDQENCEPQARRVREQGAAAVAKAGSAKRGADASVKKRKKKLRKAVE